MKLNDEELRILHGEKGPVKQKAMELLVDYGEALGASKLIETNNVCGGVGGATYIRNYANKVDNMDEVFCEFKLNTSEKLKIPEVDAFTCSLINNMDSNYWKEQDVDKEIYNFGLKNERYSKDIGYHVVFTCAPYIVGNVPVKGEHCAWMESSAVSYCNSILGARTNTEGLESTGAASIVGKIPYWGYHIKENRFGTHLVNVETEIQSKKEWGLLGYYFGEQIQEQIPVIDGITNKPNMEKLKHCGASAAASGGIELYHIVGVTPEASNLKTAFGGKKPEYEFSVDTKELKESYDCLNSENTKTDVDLVVLGCPHYTLKEIWQVCRLLKGKTISSNTQLWIFTAQGIKAIADRQGYTKQIEKAGGYLMTDTCSAIGKVWPNDMEVAATDSAKQAHYLPAISGCQTWFGSTKECIEAAITGKWKGEF